MDIPAWHLAGADLGRGGGGGGGGKGGKGGGRGGKKGGGVTPASPYEF